MCYLPMLLTLCIPAIGIAADAKDMEPIQIAKDKHSFVLADSGRRFMPWGFNYDHDSDGRLIEDYWDGEWATVDKAFADMHKLGANVVRIHLQFGKFMDAADKPNDKQLDRLGNLLKLAERERLYLDLTGLGCYHKKDVPAWYDKLSEKERWDAQARFLGGRRRAVREEPRRLLLRPDERAGRARQQGRGRRLAAGQAVRRQHFVQFVTLDPGDRTRPEIARQWIHALAAADPQKGRAPSDYGRPGGLEPRPPGADFRLRPDKVCDDLDFVCVHLYPQGGKVDEALETLHGFAAVGKPVVIEETFPLSCTQAEFEEFIDKSEGDAAGWVGFFWGKTPEDLKDAKTIGDALTRNWLRFFQKKGKTRQSGDK